jgi:hypothetical protein
MSTPAYDAPGEMLDVIDEDNHLEVFATRAEKRKKKLVEMCKMLEQQTHSSLAAGYKDKEAGC